MNHSSVFHRWILVFFIGVASLTHAAANECPVPPALAQSPEIKQLVVNLCQQFGASLDFKTGTGTNEVARAARQFAEEVRDVTEGISAKEAEAAGFTFSNIRQMALDLNDGRPWLIEVDNYAEAIEQGNKRLHGSGIDFFTYVQSPRAQLIEAFRIYSSRFPSHDISPEQLQKLSKKVYGETTSNEIVIPLSEEELSSGRSKLEKSGTVYQFVADKTVSSRADVALPPLDEPSAAEKATYGRLQLTRNVISPTLAIVAGLPGGVTWSDSEGIRIVAEKLAPSVAGGALAAGLEFQFIQWSNRWAWFWNKFGLAGNIGVNLAYGSLVTAAKVLTQTGMGVESDVTIESFLKKTMVIGTVGFVSSFGAAQIMSSKMRNRGEITESQRFLFETVSVLVNNFGRVLALTGASLGIAGGEVFRFWGQGFDSGEALGFGIQLAYLTAITLPLTLKYMWGDSTYDQITRDMLLPEVSKGTSTCWGWLGWVSNMFSPRRRAR